MINYIITFILATVFSASACTHGEPEMTTNAVSPVAPQEAASETVESSDGLEIKRNDPAGIQTELRPCPAKNPAIDPVGSDTKTLELGVAKSIGKGAKGKKTHGYTRYHCDPSK